MKRILSLIMISIFLVGTLSLYSACDNSEAGAGMQTTPGAGMQTTPGAGGQTTPGAGGQTTPGVGGQTTPGAPQTDILGSYLRYSDDHILLAYPMDWTKNETDNSVVLTSPNGKGSVSIFSEQVTQEKLDKINSLTNESLAAEHTYPPDATVGVSLEGFSVLRKTHNSIELTETAYKQRRGNVGYTAVTTCYFAVDSQLYTVTVYEHVDGVNTPATLTRGILDSLSRATS